MRKMLGRQSAQLEDLRGLRPAGFDPGADARRPAAVRSLLPAPGAEGPLRGLRAGEKAARPRQQRRTSLVRQVLCEAPSAEAL
jgi:hypothetical protein